MRKKAVLLFLLTCIQVCVLAAQDTTEDRQSIEPNTTLSSQKSPTDNNTDSVKPKTTEESNKDESEVEKSAGPITDIKGIGKGIAETLSTIGINSIEDLLKSNPDELSAKMNGASPKTVRDWQKNAKSLLQT